MNLCRGVFVAGLLCATAVAGPASAHKVNVFAYAEADSVYTESYFNDGKKCKNSTITVYTRSDEKLLEGTTDDEGLFAFPIPRREELKIVLNASMGHRAEYVLTRREVSGAGAPPPEETPVVQDSALRETPAPAREDISRAVDQALARRLTPLVEAIHRLEKKQEQTGLRDIIGGIGYIAGLMGLLYYLRNRKSR